jgi:hypothetical protein
MGDVKMYIPDPIYRIRVEGEIKLDDEDRDRIEACTAELVASGKNFTEAEADAVTQVAQGLLGKTGFVVSQADPL